MKLLNKFDDGALKLEFDEDTFHFSIRETGREVFDFNTLSSGYAAVLDIVVDIIMRMEKRTNKTFQFIDYNISEYSVHCIHTFPVYYTILECR